MKNIKTVLKNQQKQTHPVTNRYHFSVYTKDFNCSPEYVDGVLHQLGPSPLKVLNSLLRRSHSLMFVFPSYAVLAKEAGVHYNTVKNAVKKLREVGLLKTFYYHLDTLAYQLPYVFKQKQYYKDWARYLSTCLYFMFLYSLPWGYKYKPNTGSKESCLLYKTEGFIYRFDSTKYNFEDRLTSKRNFKDRSIEIAKKREVVEGKEISSYIESLSKLNLSLHGKICLTAYPDSVLKYVYEKMQTMPNLRHPFGWFVKECMSYCKANNIRPDWSKVNRLREAQGLAIDASCTVASAKDPEKGKAAPSSPVKEWQGEAQAREGVNRIDPKCLEENRKYRERMKAEGRELTLTDWDLRYAERLAANCHPDDLYKAALNVETKYKERFGKKFPNPWLNRLSKEEQEEIRLSVWEGKEMKQQKVWTLPF